jgi:O-antigen/teichoic acid export membrane protein
VSAIVEGIAAIVIGILTRSSVAFIIALLLSAVSDLVLSYLFFSVRPRLRFSPSYVREIIGYGKWVTLSGVGSWVSSQLDDFVAGRLFGTAALGVYQAGYKIATLPVTEISGTVNQVSFPALSKLREDRERFRRTFISSALLTGITGLFTALLLFFFPAEAVSFLLGPQWGEVVPLVRILALFGFIRAVESSVQPALLSLGKPSIAAWGNAIKSAALVFGLLLFSRTGLSGIAAAALVSGVAVIPYYAVTIPRLLR